MGMWVKRINYKKRQKTKKRGGGEAKPATVKKE